MIKESLRACCTGALLALLLTGCSSSSSDGGTPTSSTAGAGTGSYAGNVMGFSITVVDVVATYSPPTFLSHPYDPTKPYEAVLQLNLLDHAGGCPDVAASIKRKNSKRVFIKVTSDAASADDSAVKAGTTYQLATDDEEDSRRAQFFTYDASCSANGPRIPLSASSTRNIVITSLTATHVTGSYDIEGSDGEHASGNFDADFCTAVGPSGTPTCS
jgi:hypothetical protein